MARFYTPVRYSTPMSTAPQTLDHPAADRRGALRHPVRVEGVVSGATDARTLVVVTDISEHGCRILRPAALTGDASITLSFGGFAPFGATVVWTSPKAAGLRFDHPVHAALIAQVVSAAKGRKRAKRLLSPGLVRREERERVWHLNLPVRFEDAAAPAVERRLLKGELCDLSTDGCRIVSDVPVLPGTGLLLTIADRAPILGIVRWSEGDAIGVEFGQPLSPAGVEGLARSLH